MLHIFSIQTLHVVNRGRGEGGGVGVGGAGGRGGAGKGLDIMKMFTWRYDPPVYDHMNKGIYVLYVSLISNDISWIKHYK